MKTKQNKQENIFVRRDFQAVGFIRKGTAQWLGVPWRQRLVPIWWLPLHLFLLFEGPVLLQKYFTPVANC